MSPFFCAVTGEKTAEEYEEEVIPEGRVPEDEITAVDINPIAEDTVDSDEMFDLDENLPSDNNVSPPTCKGVENRREEMRSETKITGSSCFRYRNYVRFKDATTALPNGRSSPCISGGKTQNHL